MRPGPESPILLPPSSPIIISHVHEHHHVVLHDPESPICRWPRRNKAFDLWYAWHHMHPDSECQRTCWICPTGPEKEFYSGLTFATLEHLAEHIKAEHAGYCTVCQLQLSAEDIANEGQTGRDIFDSGPLSLSPGTPVVFNNGWSINPHLLDDSYCSESHSPQGRLDETPTFSFPSPQAHASPAQHSSTGYRMPPAPPTALRTCIYCFCGFGSMEELVEHSRIYHPHPLAYAPTPFNASSLSGHGSGGYPSFGYPHYPHNDAVWAGHSHGTMYSQQTSSAYSSAMHSQCAPVHQYSMYGGHDIQPQIQQYSGGVYNRYPSYGYPGQSANWNATPPGHVASSVYAMPQQTAGVGGSWGAQGGMPTLNQPHHQVNHYAGGYGQPYAETHHGIEPSALPDAGPLAEPSSLGSIISTPSSQRTPVAPKDKHGLAREVAEEGVLREHSSVGATDGNSSTPISSSPEGIPPLAPTRIKSPSTSTWSSVESAELALALQNILQNNIVDLISDDFMELRYWPAMQPTTPAAGRHRHWCAV
ncbi:hypothetical protein Dda_9272 [Drechslerella dactyloides]|uniref:C2H2-type domain-containing protein n=1 Tax=Drechslerella dactyloides TaxID=74499 RepID=A0AAD6IQJ0_DREDA|nr:hypothetical protein Dda_9272 [Drechslerella dactyloides]